MAMDETKMQRVARASEALDRAMDEKLAALRRRNQLIQIEGIHGPRVRNAEVTLRDVERRYDDAYRTYMDILES